MAPVEAGHGGEGADAFFSKILVEEILAVYVGEVDVLAEGAEGGFSALAALLARVVLVGAAAELVVGGEEEGFAIVLDFVAEAAGDDVIDLEGLDGGAADFDRLRNVAGVPVANWLVGGAAIWMGRCWSSAAGGDFSCREVCGHHGVVD